jgi:DNA-binding XRE family transcriptional regulator
MNDMGSIPREEFERLVAAAEMLSDIAAYDRAMAKGGEGMPGEVVRRIVSGENPVRVIREWRGMSGAELARRAGLHRVQVHEIETGRKTGSVATLKQIAIALDVPLDDIA